VADINKSKDNISLDEGYRYKKIFWAKTSPIPLGRGLVYELIEKVTYLSVIR
jgi:hypothetical protein